METVATRAAGEHARIGELALKNISDMMMEKGPGMVSMTLIDFQAIQAWSTLAQAHFTAANYYKE